MIDDLYINKAREFAQKAHEGQTRKTGGPYFAHCERVAQNVMYDYRAIAYCHDVIEDCEGKLFPLSHILTEFDFKIVAHLTKRTYENYYDFILRLILIDDKDERMAAISVKLADLYDNLSDKEEGAAKDKYLLAQYILNAELDRILECFVLGQK